MLTLWPGQQLWEIQGELGSHLFFSVQTRVCLQHCRLSRGRQTGKNYCSDCYRCWRLSFGLPFLTPVRGFTTLLPIPGSGRGSGWTRHSWLEERYSKYLSSPKEAAKLWSCVNVEVAVLGSPIPNSLYGLCGHKATEDLNHDNSELRSCVKVEVDVLGFRP